MKRNKYLRLMIVLLLCSIASPALSQKDTTWKMKPEITFSGFLDVFYVYDLNRPSTSYRQKFLYNHNRHNEFNLNLGLIKLKVDHAKYRANLAFQAGTYVDDNYSKEPGSLRNISEANVGLSMNKKNRVWLDVGIFPSHIGFENAVSINNPTLTRSLSAENSPYFESGAKVTFKPNEKWEIAGLALNGWQRIQRIPGNSLLSFGTQLHFTPNKKFQINWSTFIGTTDPDISRRIRYFSNLYAKFKPFKNLNFIAGFDYGVQQVTKNSSNYNHWVTPVLIAQLKLSSKWNTAFRIEYFKDEFGVIIPISPGNGISLLGFSMNFDYCPIPNLALRFEGRWLSSDKIYFTSKNGFTQENFIIGGSIAFAFVEQLNGLKK